MIIVTMAVFINILQFFSGAIKHQLQSITTAEREQFDKKSFTVNIVKDNIGIIDKVRGWE